MVGPAAGIFASVGLLVPAWAAAGVTSQLISAGLDLISPRFFLVSAALFTALASFATGTSWGTVSTAGVALMGVARAQGLDPALAAAAVMAGSHFGDKLSPLSETATLASTVAGTNLYTHIRHTLYTTVPAFAAGLVLFLALGAGAPLPAGAEVKEALQEGLQAAHRLHGVLWLPAALVLAAALLRWPVIPSLLVSAGLAAVLAILVQGFPIRQVPDLLWRSYRPATGDATVDALLIQGGLWSMVQLAAAAILMFAVVAAAVRSGPGRRAMASLAGFARTRARAVAAAVLLCLGLILLSGSSYLSILVTGELMRDIFRRLGLAGENLSRTLEDSGTMVAPLVPWGVSGLFMSRSLGVSTWEYGPYALLNYGGFLLALLYGYTGWFVGRLDSVRARPPRR